MKRLYLLRVEFWWFWEKCVCRLWGYGAGDRAAYWFDPVPAFFSNRRWDAEHAFFLRFQETLYGEPMRFP